MLAFLLFTLLLIFAVYGLTRLALKIRKNGESLFERIVCETVGWVMLATMYLGPVVFVSYTSREAGDRELRRRAELRNEYRMESMSARLKYETARDIDESESGTDKFSPEVEQRLTSFEEQWEPDLRSFNLKELHDKATDEFVKNALLNGFLRMHGVHQSDVELPEYPPVPFNDPDKSSRPYVPDRDDSVAAPLATSSDSSLSETVLALYHDAGLTDFLAPRRMGYVQDREHVAGFLSHQFGKAPQFPVKERHTDEWRVVRLELVSLLKHDTPVVYVSKNLPRMDELTNAPTRPLDEMERAALPQLRRERDVVIEHETNVIQMLGSIRANKTCLKCHSVKRGALLGAFTYELRRLKPILQPACPKTGDSPPT